MADKTDPESSDAGKIRLIMKLRQANLKEPRVLAAMEAVPREVFVPVAFADRAYDNTALPLACGQTISQPEVVAFMTEALNAGERMKILEIGTGSGYQTAILSRLCRRVYSIERYRSLLGEAEARFARLGITNITTRHGDGSRGWPEQAPFERIIVTAAAPDVPPLLLDQLAEGGEMVLPLGEVGECQQIVRVRRTLEGAETEDLMAVRFVPLMEGLPRES